MIPRYTRPEMASIWEPLTRFKIWFEIEAHAADAQAELGVIPKEAAKTIWAKGKDAPFDVARIDEIEREVKHDVIAFLTHLAEIVGPGVALRAPGHDLVRRARHLFQRSAHPRRGPADRRHRQGAGGAEEARLRAQDDADHRPLACHPRRAGHVRPEARLSPMPNFRAPASAWSPRARKSRPARSRARSARSRISIRASRNTSPGRWASRSSRSRRRSSRATATRCILRRSA